MIDLNKLMESTIVDVECSYGKEIVTSELYKTIYQQGRTDAINEFLKIATKRIRDDSCGCAWDAKNILLEIAERLKK